MAYSLGHANRPSLSVGGGEDIRNVDDGDMLTLVDEWRVRFLITDTLAIKEQQAFAQEAKAYTNDLCGTNNRKTIMAHF